MLRLPPLLGMWISAIAAALTLAGIQLNQVFIQVLVDRATPPPLEHPQHTPPHPSFVMQA